MAWWTFSSSSKDEQVYVIEVNPRASGPFLSCPRWPIFDAPVATRLILGKLDSHAKIGLHPESPWFISRRQVFSFTNSKGWQSLGTWNESTGEVMAVTELRKALYKALKLPISICQALVMSSLLLQTKEEALRLALRFASIMVSGQPRNSLLFWKSRPASVW